MSQNYTKFWGQKIKNSLFQVSFAVYYTIITFLFFYYFTYGEDWEISRFSKILILK